MAIITASWTDRNLDRFTAGVVALHSKLPNVLPRIINQVGDRTKTQVTRALTKQTGLPRRTIVKAIGRPTRAHAGSLSYTMATEGGDIRLTYLAPRETRKGVSAAPWGKRKVFADTFMRGGRFPNRVAAPRLGGHVWRRLDTAGRQITQARSGVVIPAEMTSGATAAAFEAIAAPLLKQRVEAAIAKLMP